MKSIFVRFADNVSPVIKELLNRDPDAFLARGRIIKNDRTTTVAEVDFDGQKYLVKRYNARSIGHRFKRALRESRASICWRNSIKFDEVGLHVAQPIAMLERRHWFFRGNAYFICSWLDGEELLEWMPSQRKETLLAVTNEMGKMFDIFEKQKISHGDMKASNLLWVDNLVYLVDLDSSKCHSSDVLWRRANNRDKRRFVRNGKVFKRVLENTREVTV